MTEWVPVSQVIGNIPLAPPTPPAASPYGSTGAAGAGVGPQSGATPAASPGAGPSPALPVYGATGTASPAAAGGTVYGGPAAASPTPSYSGANIPAGGTVYGAPGAPGGPVYPSGAGTAPGYAALPGGPVPPDLHWALVLLINFFCGLFGWVWMFIEASFVKKLRPDCNAIMFFVSGIVTAVLAFVVLIGGVISAGAAQPGRAPDVPIGLVLFFYFLLLCGSALIIVGNFKLREALLDYYNTVEPVNLRLSGVMTFFFALYYFQYHFSRIAAWKKTGYLTPQQ
jgi:hypothetical protein